MGLLDGVLGDIVKEAVALGHEVSTIKDEVVGFAAEQSSFVQGVKDNVTSISSSITEETSSVIDDFKKSLDA